MVADQDPYYQAVSQSVVTDIDDSRLQQLQLPLECMNVDYYLKIFVFLKIPQRTHTKHNPHTPSPSTMLYYNVEGGW